MENFWLKKIEESKLFVIIEYAHRNDKLVENLIKADIKEALSAYLKDPLHKNAPRLF